MHPLAMLGACRTLQRQEMERAAALEAFKANIAARAQNVGNLVLAASNQQAEREEQLMKASLERAEQEAEVCCPVGPVGQSGYALPDTAGSKHCRTIAPLAHQHLRWVAAAYCTALMALHH